jgi:quercetin dioxygenase-like cupin family protein
MDAQKVIKELGEKYPGKKILDNHGEIVCETEPAAGPGARGVAVAVVDRSIPHFHKKTVETYKVLKGGLTVFKNDKPYKMRKGDVLEIIPGEVHYAIGNETWMEVVSVPGWSPEDSFPDNTWLGS